MKNTLFACIITIHLLAACTQPAKLQSHQIAWENKHKNDINLAGIEMVQVPEGAVGESESAYLHGHPGMVLYYFWDGKVRQMGFEADGTLNEDFYWPNKLQAGDAHWSAVDFSVGSDPAFKGHRDPRQKGARHSCIHLSSR